MVKFPTLENGTMNKGQGRGVFIWASKTTTSESEQKENSPPKGPKNINLALEDCAGSLPLQNPRQYDCAGPSEEHWTSCSGKIAKAIIMRTNGIKEKMSYAYNKGGAYMGKH